MDRLTTYAGLGKVLDGRRKLPKLPSERERAAAQKAVAAFHESLDTGKQRRTENRRAAKERFDTVFVQREKRRILREAKAKFGRTVAAT